MAFSSALRTAATFLLPPTQFSTERSSSPSSGALLKPKQLRPTQVRCNRDSEVKISKSLSLSRRDAMICLTAFTAAGIGMSSPGAAEARVTKADIRRKIREKLNMLREKAGLSKQNEADIGKSSPAPPSSSKKENKLPLESSPLPLPDPPEP